MCEAAGIWARRENGVAADILSLAHTHWYAAERAAMSADTMLGGAPHTPCDAARSGELWAVATDCHQQLEVTPPGAASSRRCAEGTQIAPPGLVAQLMHMGVSGWPSELPLLRCAHRFVCAG